LIKEEGGNLPKKKKGIRGLSRKCSFLGVPVFPIASSQPFMRSVDEGKVTKEGGSQNLRRGKLKKRA